MTVGGRFPQFVHDLFDYVLIYLGTFTKKELSRLSCGFFIYGSVGSDLKLFLGCVLCGSCRDEPDFSLLFLDSAYG